eukprot:492137-Pelagomonas_calceolata.AAC.7
MVGTHVFYTLNAAAAAAAGTCITRSPCLLCSTNGSRTSRQRSTRRVECATHLELQALVFHAGDHCRAAVANGGHNGSVGILTCEETGGGIRGVPGTLRRNFLANIPPAPPVLVPPHQAPTIDIKDGEFGPEVVEHAREHAPGLRPDELDAMGVAQGVHSLGLFEAGISQHSYLVGKKSTTTLTHADSCCYCCCYWSWSRCMRVHGWVEGGTHQGILSWPCATCHALALSHLELLQEAGIQVCSRGAHIHGCVQLLQLVLAGLCAVLAHVLLVQVELGGQVGQLHGLLVMDGHSTHSRQDDIFGCGVEGQTAGEGERDGHGGEEERGRAQHAQLRPGSLSLFLSGKDPPAPNTTTRL